VELQSRRSLNWTLRWDDQQHLLMAEAGDDERFGLSELDALEAAPLLSAWGADSFAALADAPLATQTALEKLRLLGAVTSGPTPTTTKLRVWAIPVGQAAKPAVNALTALHRDHLEFLEPDGSTNVAFAVVLRCGGSYAHLLTATNTLAHIPHLFVDASFHHTVSIGPVVVPGVSACLGCLTARLRARWAETTPPPIPMVSEHPELLAALSLDEILKWQQGKSLLVGKVRQIDTHTWHTATDTLLKTTPCQRCLESETP
jgi:hypothetical protein